MLNIRTKHCLICDNILYQNDIVETNAFSADHFALPVLSHCPHVDDSDRVLNQLVPNDCMTFSSAEPFKSIVQKTVVYKTMFCLKLWMSLVCSSLGFPPEVPGARCVRQFVKDASLIFLSWFKFSSEFRFNFFKVPIDEFRSQ